MEFDAKKSFGYPVLRDLLAGEDPELLDYPKKTFEPSVSFKVDANNPESLLLKYEISLNVAELKEAVGNGTSEFHLRVKCQKTFYCQTFRTSDFEGDIKLEGKQFRDLVEISVLLVAKKDFVLTPKSCHSDFRGVDFSIARGNVLAWGAPTSYSVEREQFRSVRAIFDFNKNDEVPVGEFLLRTDEDYVGVDVHPSMYDSVRIAENDPKRRLLILNSLYVPVLMQLLYILKSAPELADEYRWASVLVAKCNQLEIDIDEEHKLPSNAQKLLHMPLDIISRTGFRSPQ